MSDARRCGERADVVRGGELATVEWSHATALARVLGVSRGSPGERERVRTLRRAR